MTRLPTPGQDSGQWGTILNDFLSQTHTSTGTLKDGVVDSSHIRDNAITSSKLAAGAVTSVKIKDGDIDNTKLANNTIASTKLDTTIQNSLAKADTAVQSTDLGTAATMNVGTGSGTVAAGSHASQHAAGGVDPITITPADIGAIGSTDNILSLAPKLTASARPLSPYWINVGDSITQGSGATTSTKWTSQLKLLVGHDVVLSSSVNSGVAGETSAAILARIPSILAASPAPQAMTLLCGTNDSATPVATATYLANVLSIIDLCKVAGVPIIVGTVPPREVGDVAENAAISAYNHALRVTLPLYGTRLADVHAALVDPTTGALATAYDSGDGTHPNAAGHLKIAEAFASATTATDYSWPWPVHTAGEGLWIDPLGADAPGTRWSVPSGSVGSSIPASEGDCPYGQWSRFTVDNSGGSSTIYRTNVAYVTTGFSDGDELSAWLIARGSTTLALNKVQVTHSGAVSILAMVEAFPTAGPCRIIRQVTVPVGATAIGIAITVRAAAGEVATVDIACLNVFNHTTGGYTSFM